MRAKVRSITTARTAGPLGQFYKALLKSGAHQCSGCRDFVRRLVPGGGHSTHVCSGVPAVSQRWDYDLVATNAAPVDPVDREWNELEAEEANTRGEVA